MYEGDQDNNEGFQTIINTYETLVSELTQELHTLKYEQDNLKTQLTEVIRENNQLAEKLQTTLSSTQNEIYKSDNQEISNNLRDQINTLVTEKEYVTKLWQEAVKTIDHLEDELKIYQAGTESFMPKKEFQKLKYIYEEKINDLELKLVATQKQLETSIKTVKTKIEEKHSEVDQSLENQASALKIVKNLEAEILRLQKRLQETVDEKIRLERFMGNKEDTIQSLKKANSDCLSRVTEAVSIVEAALNEKDAALFRQKQVEEENEKLLQEVTEVIKQSQDKIKTETIRISNEYNEKQKVFRQNLEKKQKEIQDKSIEIEAMNKKCSLLENEIDRMHRGHCTVEESDINKMLVLEKNLESTFQKLLISEKQNIQLIADKETIKNDLDQMANMYERNLKSKEIETSTLKSKITRLEAELNDSNGQVDRISKKLSLVDDQITKTERDFKEERDKYEMGLKTTYDQRIEELTSNYNSNIKELQSQIEKQTEVNQKWRKETKTITDDLQKVITNLKLETQVLKKENKLLKENCRKSEEKAKQYKMFLELISKDVNKISNLTLGAGVS